MYMTSASAMAETTDDSLMRKITFATMPGVDMLTACGTITRVSVCQVLKPSMYAFSRWICGTDCSPARIDSAM